MLVLQFPRGTSSTPQAGSVQNSQQRRRQPTVCLVNGHRPKLCELDRSFSAYIQLFRVTLHSNEAPGTSSDNRYETNHHPTAATVKLHVPYVYHLAHCWLPATTSPRAVSCSNLPDLVL